MLGAVLAPVAQVIEMSASPYHTKVVYEAWSANPVMLLVLVAAAAFKWVRRALS